MLETNGEPRRLCLDQDHKSLSGQCRPWVNRVGSRVLAVCSFLPR
jgi:hypothetical protein